MNAIPRWLVAAFAFIFLLLVAGGGWFYRAQKQRVKSGAEANLQAIAHIKAAQIAQWRTEHLADAREIMERPFTVERIGRWMADPQSEITGQILTWFRSMQEHHHFHDILLLDLLGRPRLSLSGRPDPLHPEAVRAMADALRERRPVLTELHAGPGDLGPHIGVIAPLFSGTGESAQPIGALLQQIDPRHFLYPLFQSWPAPSHSAETLLVRRDGDAVLFLNDLRHQQDTALKLRIPLERKEVPAVMAVLGREGVMDGKDYRGIEVLSVLKAVPDSPWFIVAKIDTEEILADWRFQSGLILVMIVGLLAATAAVMGMAWQRYAKTHYRTLYQSEAALRRHEARYATTLLSIGDGVISADSHGRVELLNPVAEKLTGWRQEEASGKDVAEVFRIVNEETRLEVESPAARVLREGIVVGLANHTLLIARDGRERPIADSGAPIRGEKGETTGVVLVFRDQTEELAALRALLESEEKYRNLYDEAPVGYIELDSEGRIAKVNKKELKMLGCTAEEVVGRHAWSFVVEKEEAETLIKAKLAGHRPPGRNLERTHRRKDGTVIPVIIDDHILKDAKGRITGMRSTIQDITERKLAEEEKERLQAQLLQAQKMESVGRLAGGVAHDFNNMLGIIIGNTELALMNTDAADPRSKNLQEISKAGQRSADIVRQLLAFARKQIISPKVLDLNETVQGIIKMLRRLIGEEIEMHWRPGKNLWSVRMDPAQIDQLLANLVVNGRDAIAGTGIIALETGNAVFDEPYCREHAGTVPGEYVLLAVSDTGAGMSREVMEQIFDPFFTTKEIGRGTGLGLAMVYGIVKQNSGFINVYSEPGQGTTFKVYLPRLRAEETADQGEAAPKVPLPGTETVLLVEDEGPLLNTCKAILEEQGYTVLATRSPSEAVSLAREHAGEIHLLITDVVMPEMNGRELVERLQAVRPSMKCLFMSGYTADVIAHHGVLDKGVRFIEKPFAGRALSEKVREVLDGR